MSTAVMSAFVPKADIGLMGCTAMKSEKASRDEPLLPPKADHCGLRLLIDKWQVPFPFPGPLL